MSLRSSRPRKLGGSVQRQLDWARARDRRQQQAGEQFTRDFSKLASQMVANNSALEAEKAAMHAAWEAERAEKLRRLCAPEPHLEIPTPTFFVPDASQVTWDFHECNNDFATTVYRFVDAQ